MKIKRFIAKDMRQAIRDIREDQGPDAESDRFGRYEYEAILKALGRDGHRVISEARKTKTNPWEYARKIVTEIEELKKTGLPSPKITVVGASKGAAIVVLISHLSKDANINYVLLAICEPGYHVGERYFSDKKHVPILDRPD